MCNSSKEKKLADPSFSYSIFKKFQATGGTDLVFGYGHLSADADPELAGGFSLQDSQDQYGLYKHLSPHASDYTADGVTALDPMMQPLNPASNDPMQNPLYVMLKASLTPGGIPGGGPYYFVTVNGQNWPVMPPPDLSGLPTNHPDWVEFNTGSHTLIDAFATWISNGKTDDSPLDAPLTKAALAATVLKPFGFPKGTDVFPILFIASMPGDDGRRPGDKGLPVALPDHVPAHFWATSQIFLTYPAGVPGHAAGTIAHPANLLPGEEYYVAAIIGNAGNVPTGRVMGNNKILVVCEAQAFNSGFGPATQPLPALANLDMQSTWPLYEQYGLGKERYDVIGFRFNVDAVIAGLKQALSDAGTNLGGLSADEWLNEGHPCVKVLIRGGEPLGPYTLDPNAPPTFDSNPRTERHAAQRNLAPFFIPPLMGAKKIGWKNFIVGQIGSGANGLALQHALPSEAFRFYLAMPSKSYERYVAKDGARGFEVVSTVANKPFPDAVILRQTSAPATLRVAEHAHERFLGMSLGIECDPARIKGLRLSDVSMVQSRHDGTIAGGFTLQLQMGK
jgi:hypothetical protein